MPRKRFGRNRKNRCRFCTRDGCPRPAYVDYKDIGLLKKLCTNQNKVFSRKRSGSCATFQRAASAAIKRARGSWSPAPVRRREYLRRRLGRADLRPGQDRTSASVSCADLRLTP